MSDSEIAIRKLVSRQWKTLETKGDDVTIKDPKLGQGYLGDLSKKTVVELEEIFKRNEQVLSNKSLVSKLKDKGKSLQKRQDEISKALEEARQKQMCKDSPDQKDIHGFEWTGSLSSSDKNEKKNNGREDPLEDGDDLDPLELMAHHSSSVDHRQERSHRSVDEDPASAIARELEELEINDAIQEKQEKTTPQENTFGFKRDQMIQKKYEHNGPPRTSFKPFRPVENPKPIPGLVIHQKPKQERPVVCISQEESHKLEKDYLDKQKERELKRTIEVLGQPNKVSNICEIPSKSMGNYRDTNVSKHILDSEDEEESEEEGLYLRDGDVDDEDIWD